MKSSLFWLIVIGSCLQLTHVRGYSSGADRRACGDMVPGHGGRAQSGDGGYKVTLSSSTYSDLSVIAITLSGDKSFGGFLVQVRRSNSQFATPIGKFTPNSQGKNVRCGEENQALTHTSASNKKSVTFSWQAPSSNLGNLEVLATFVKTYSSYWVKVSSSVITFSPAVQTTQTTLPSTEPTMPTSTRVPSVSSTPHSAIVTKVQSDIPPGEPLSIINPDHECGSSISCFRQCGDHGCKFLVAWKDIGNGYVSFLMQTNLLQHQGDYWTAVAFSSDFLMDNDSVIECNKIGDRIEMRQSYNVRRGNRPVTSDVASLRVLSTSFNNSILMCQFERLKRSNHPEIFNLDEDWAVLFAFGKLSSHSADSKELHDETSISESRINISHIIDEVTLWTYNGGNPDGESNEEKSTETPQEEQTNGPTSQGVNGCATFAAIFPTMILGGYFMYWHLII